MLSTISRFYKLLSTPITTDIIGEIFFQKKPMDIDNFLDKFSTVVDKEILRISEKESLIPIGGELKIKFVEDSQDISIFWDFYFQDKKQKIIKKSSGRLIKNNLFTKDFIDFVKVRNPIYPISAPNISQK